MTDGTLTCAGAKVPDALDRIRRYCGLTWSGGGAEVWAYRYYDALPAEPEDPVKPKIHPIDVVTCAALHPGLSRRDLAFFASTSVERIEVRALREYPVDVSLADATTQDLTPLRDLRELADGVGLSILTKVLHRRRPEFVPIFDKRIVDAYRPITGSRGEDSWPHLVEAIRADLADRANRRVLDGIQAELATEIDGPVPSHLRLLDIAVWMGGER